MSRCTASYIDDSENTLSHKIFNKYNMNGCNPGISFIFLELNKLLSKGKHGEIIKLCRNNQMTRYMENMMKLLPYTKTCSR